MSGTGEIVREVNSAGQRAHYSRPAKSNGPASAPRDPAACRPVRGGMEKRVTAPSAEAAMPVNLNLAVNRGVMCPSGNVGIEGHRGEVADSDVESRRLFGCRCAGSGVKSFRTG